MSRRSFLPLPWDLLALLACQDPTGTGLPGADFGYVTLTFQGRQLRFYTGLDSVIAFYQPPSSSLFFAGSTAPGPAQPDYVLLTLDSVSATHPYPLGRPRPLPYLGVGFYELPRTDSSGVFPFHTAGDSADRITFEALDFVKCEVRGTLHATLFFPDDPTPYPVEGAFWGRMVNNSLEPGPC
jgi:hypothetical protein